MSNPTHTQGCGIRLVYLTANAAWTFTFGDQLLRMRDEDMFYVDRADAVYAAGLAGLSVSRNGVVTSS